MGELEIGAAAAAWMLIKVRAGRLNISGLVGRAGRNNGSISLPGQSDTDINSASSGRCIKRRKGVGRDRRTDGRARAKLLRPAAKQKMEL